MAISLQFHQYVQCCDIVKLQWAQHLPFRHDISLQSFSDFMSVIVESVSKVVIFSGGQSDKSRSKDKGFVHTHADEELH